MRLRWTRGAWVRAARACVPAALLCHAACPPCIFMSRGCRCPTACPLRCACPCPPSALCRRAGRPPRADQDARLERRLGRVPRQPRGALGGLGGRAASGSASSTPSSCCAACWAACGACRQLLTVLRTPVLSQLNWAQLVTHRDLRQVLASFRRMTWCARAAGSRICSARSHACPTLVQLCLMCTLPAPPPPRWQSLQGV